MLKPFLTNELNKLNRLCRQGVGACFFIANPNVSKQLFYTDVIYVTNKFSIFAMLLIIHCSYESYNTQYLNDNELKELW